MFSILNTYLFELLLNQKYVFEKFFINSEAINPKGISKNYLNRSSHTKGMDPINTTSQSQKAINELIQVVSRLREPINGCPWDIKQSHESLIPYAIEEAHEVADAIYYGTDDNLCDELGDLLLQIIFHAQIANEENRFSFNEIAKGVAAKMVRRHPHVFQKTQINSVDDIESKWEELKRLEQAAEHEGMTFSKILKNKVRSKSPLSGAIYIAKKMLRNFPNLESIEEPWSEIKSYIDLIANDFKKKDKKDREKIIGDLLFLISSVSVLSSLNPEEALRKSNKRFLKKLSYLEENIKGEDLTNISIQKLRLLWRKATNFFKNDNS